MRCIHERKLLEEKLFAAELTDALTGLTNRRAFMTMLGHVISHRKHGCVALFEIDHFRAINLRFGQSVGDDVLVVFARLLQESTGRQDTISRVGSHTLGVLFPGARIHRAEAVCRDIVATLSEARDSRHSPGLTITASAGLSANVGSVDETIRNAELAKLLAKAKGRNRLELAGHSSSRMETTKTTNPCVNLHPVCWNEPGQLQPRYCAA
ncbi:MAG TPA: GGDEF domain-containing protein [Sphingomonadaceae bacterium]|nr:GGDEF domain-containing protein [Sphingomonadaceae bacterium]